jgi:hypothetical protein
MSKKAERENETKDRIVKSAIECYHSFIQENKASMIMIFLEGINVDDHGDFIGLESCEAYVAKKEEDIIFFIEKMVVEEYQKSYRDRIKAGETAVVVIMYITGKEKMIPILRWFHASIPTNVDSNNLETLEKMSSL